MTPKDLATISCRYVSRGQRNLTKFGLAQSSARLLPPGTVVLTTRAPIGYVAIAATHLATNQGCRNLVLRNDQVPEFWFYLLKFHRPILEAHASGTTFKELSGSTLKSLEFDVPNAAEQRAIAEVLGALDDKIEANVRLSVLCERLAITQLSTVTRRRRLEELALTSRCQLQPQQFADLIVEYFSLPAFDKGRLPDRCSGSTIRSSKFRIDRPSVLVSKLNPHIPRVWYVEPDPQAVALASTEFVVLQPRLKCTAATLWAACASREFSSLLSGKVTGTTGSRQRVREQDILGATVPDAAALSLRKQELIDALVQRALAARRESEALAQLRDALLPPLISGELRVRDAESLVSEAL